MDVWRYSDWWGLGAEVRNSQKHIWQWRDWIVESLNADKGYDQMVREMLAADELYPDDLDRLRASGFLARQYFRFNRTTWMDETVEHTSKAFLGLTFNCSKCHDHKYDPIAQDRAHRHTRVERTVRVLEHDLDAATQRAQLGAARGQHVDAVEHDRSARGGREAEDAPRDGALPAARFPHQGQHLAAGDRERDAVNRPDWRAAAASEQAARPPEVRHQVAHLEQGRHVRRAARRSGSAWSQQRRPRWSPSGSSAGSSLEQRSQA
jgi:hypothetical protein